MSSNRTSVFAAAVLAFFCLSPVPSRFAHADDWNPDRPLPRVDAETCRQKDLEFLDRLGHDFAWEAGQAQKRGDRRARKANARFTAMALQCFYVLAADKEIDPLQHRSSFVLLGWSYLVLGDDHRAEQIYVWLQLSEAQGLPDPGPSTLDHYAAEK